MIIRFRIQVNLPIFHTMEFMFQGSIIFFSIDIDVIEIFNIRLISVLVDYERFQCCDNTNMNAFNMVDVWLIFEC